MNTLYFGDNLDILDEFVADESVDLIYLDPPFNSQADYNLVFERRGSANTSAQAGAFEDTWTWGREAELALHKIMTFGGATARFIEALRLTMGESNLMAYIAMMTVRLHALRRVLRPSGSLYLHCDPTASHYLKIILDQLFGPDRFRNEIVWKRTTAHSSSKKFAPVHDVILYYSKSTTCTWNAPRLPYSEEYLNKYYRFDDGDGQLYWRDNLCAAGVRHGDSGKPWRGIDPSEKGMHWKFRIQRLEQLDAEGRIYWPPRGTMPQYKRYRHELKGRAVADLWTDIDRINPVGAERIGYPTQKPLALMSRIIEASSNPGDTVLDPFCGCGTTIEAAERAGRSWIGIDIAVHAIKVIESRLAAKIGPHVSYTVEGMPKDFQSAMRLADRNKYQFQWWANYLFNPHALREQKKGADRGIDGEIFFPNGPGRAWGRMLTSVKGGTSVGPSMVRDFRGVLEREGAEMGIFICLYKPTRAMAVEAAAAGIADTVHGDLPRLQTVAIEEWFEGKRPALPPLERLPAAELAASRRRTTSKAKRSSQAEFQYVFSGVKADEEALHLNPAMVRSGAKRRAG